jgi:hypothetical protein
MIRDQSCYLSETLSFKLFLHLLVKTSLVSVVLRFEIFNFYEGHRFKLPDWVTHRSRPQLLIWFILITPIVLIN